MTRLVFLLLTAKDLLLCPYFVCVFYFFCPSTNKKSKRKKARHEQQKECEQKNVKKKNKTKIEKAGA